jgi:transcriptional regulator NrdR family protein
MAGKDKNPESNTRAAGLECPRCGCRHLYVVYTRQRLKKILRVRECRHCGRRINTYEQPAG